MQNQIPPSTQNDQLRSINEVIDELITDPTLAKVLVGNLPSMQQRKTRLPSLPMPSSWISTTRVLTA